MPQDRTGGGDTSQRMFDLNRPQGYAKDDYLWQWKVANDTVFSIIQKSNSNQNTRDILTAVMFSASLIAHDHIRRREEILFSAAIDHIENLGMVDQNAVKKAIIEHIANENLKPEEKAELIMKVCYQPQMSDARKSQEILRVCAITMGNLTSYVDQFRGLAHTLKVGELYNFEKPYAKKTKAWDDDASDTIEL